MTTTTTQASRAIPTYAPAADRYEKQPYRRCGRSGVDLPAISLGLWHNFGGEADHENCRQMCFTAFDLGVTHFDLANNYGPPPGSAEERFGRILRELPREEVIVSTKAGFRMWPGPYGEWGSRKNLLQSLDQSLKRLGVDHVDLFYHHRPDPGTPLEESLGALDQAVRSGKALYAGISNYSGVQTADAVRVVEANRFPKLLIHQVSYSLFRRGPETDLFGHTERHGLGVIAFCPLAQGLLTNKYLGGEIPADSRAASATGFLKPKAVTDDKVQMARKLSALAQQRGQSLAQMALAWVLRDKRVTSALIGASRPQQIVENVAALKCAAFSDEELKTIDAIVA
jgi:L-glyceraldehyde 3-phosphate reductase